MFAIFCHDGVLVFKLRRVKTSASELRYVLAVKDPVMNRLCVKCMREEFDFTNFIWLNLAVTIK